MTFPGFSSPAVGPEAPLEMLAACHTRVEKQCQTLTRLQAHLPVHGADAAAQEAAQAVMRYFDTAAQHHHEDEEQDLFPALLETALEGDAARLHTLIQLLLEEHRQLGARWSSLRNKLAAVSEGSPTVLQAPEIEDFTGAYRKHIIKEDTELLPMAQRLLGETALARIGQAMRLRRSL
jgi:hemerythrin-like domain-containing protein